MKKFPPPLGASRLSVSFFYSFILSSSVARSIARTPDQLDLEIVPPHPKAFRPWLGLNRPACVVRFMGGDLQVELEGVDLTEQGARRSSRSRTARSPSPLRADLKRRFHLDRSGVIGYVVELSCDSSALTAEAVIALASAGDDGGPESTPRLKLPAITDGGTWVQAGGVVGISDCFDRDRTELVRRYRDLLNPSIDLGDVCLDYPANREERLVRDQQPQVLTVLTFANEDSYRLFRPDAPLDFARRPDNKATRRRIAQQFSAILFRWKSAHSDHWADVAMSYVAPAGAASMPVWRNLHVHRDIYIAHNIRSTLVAVNASATSIDGKEVAAFTTPAIEETLCDIRGHWYGYQYITAMLEQSVDRLTEDGRGAISVEVALQNLNATRQLLLALLDRVTAPRLVSDTLALIHQQVGERLGVATLRSQALDKMSLLESLIAGVRQYDLYRQLNERLNRSPEPVDPTGTSQE